MGIFKSASKNQIDQAAGLPVHIAIIMDGNGRWAKKKLKPRVFGHQAGMNKVKEITLHANELGIKVLTLYAFSTENWGRPSDEVSFLMKLPIDFFDTFMPDLIKNNVKVMVTGDISGLPKETQKAVNNAIEETADNTGLILNFALNYGGMTEIVSATRTIAQQVADGKIETDDINIKLIKDNLQTNFLGELSDPDLIIRTSGEYRLSNFLPIQSAYSELFFTDVMWPDFKTQDLDEAIESYSKRKRRFGKI